jgi:hypothetical protein
MAAIKYTAAFLFQDGKLLAEAQSEDTKYANGAHIIQTQAKKFAGISPGAPSFAITVENAMPRAGIEADYYGLVKNMTEVEMILHRSAKKLTSKGFLMEVNEKHGVANPATLSYTFQGSAPEEIA